MPSLGSSSGEDRDEDVGPPQAPMKGDCFGTLRCRIKLGPQRTLSAINLCKQASEPMLD